MKPLSWGIQPTDEDRLASAEVRKSGQKDGGPESFFTSFACWKLQNTFFFLSWILWETEKTRQNTNISDRKIKDKIEHTTEKQETKKHETGKSRMDIANSQEVAHTFSRRMDRPNTCWTSLSRCHFDLDIFQEWTHIHINHAWRLIRNIHTLHYIHDVTWHDVTWHDITLQTYIHVQKWDQIRSV